MKNKKYQANKSNLGIIPKMKDERLAYVETKCGICMECKKAKSNEWRVRLKEELRHDKKAIFVTLTFSDESLVRLSKKVTKQINEEIEFIKNNYPPEQARKPLIKLRKKLTGYEHENAIATESVKEFREKWRGKLKTLRRNKETKETKIKYWLITEIGGSRTERIHLHGIIWTENPELIEELWANGFHKNQYVNEQTINYITKYVYKVDVKHKYYNPIVRSSNGIGKGYLKRPDAQRHRYKGKDTIRHYVDRTGVKTGLPQYISKKLWNDEEREEMLINALNENIKYVDGSKIDMNQENAKERYKQAIEHAIIKSKRLGYNNPIIDDKKRAEENEKRIEQNLNRLRKEHAINKRNKSNNGTQDKTN